MCGAQHCVQAPPCVCRRLQRSAGHGCKLERALACEQRGRPLAMAMQQAAQRAMFCHSARTGFASRFWLLALIVYKMDCHLPVAQLAGLHQPGTTAVLQVIRGTQCLLVCQCWRHTVIASQFMHHAAATCRVEGLTDGTRHSSLPFGQTDGTRHLGQQGACLADCCRRAATRSMRNRGCPGSAT